MLPAENIFLDIDDINVFIFALNLYEDYHSPIDAILAAIGEKKCATHTSPITAKIIIERLKNALEVIITQANSSNQNITTEGYDVIRKAFTSIGTSNVNNNTIDNSINHFKQWIDQFSLHEYLKNKKDIIRNLYHIFSPQENFQENAQRQQHFNVIDKGLMHLNEEEIDAMQQEMKKVCNKIRNILKHYHQPHSLFSQALSQIPSNANLNGLPIDLREKIEQRNTSFRGVS